MMRAARSGWSEANAALATAFRDEAERWPLFLPVALGLGIGLYFALPREPPRDLGLSLLAGCLCLGLFSAMLLRRRAGLILAIGLGAVAMGFALAQARSARVDAPVLAHQFGPVRVTGQIDTVEARAKGARITLRAPRLPGLTAAATPARVRVTLRAPPAGLAPGLWVEVQAKLFPPPPPPAPGAYDYPRAAYFQRLGAVGFAFGHVKVIAPPPGAAAGGILERITVRLHRIRHQVSQRIFAVLPGAVGGMAAALTTGERSYVPERVQEAMRDAGLAHLLAIAGLHLSLVAGGLFFAVRLLIAAWPALALRVDGRKWAAFVSLSGAFLYLLMSGAAVPTQRAFMMTAVVLVAILLDRRAISLHLVGWAALLVLIIQPESLIEAGFQMSFAAVLALVAAYEAWGRHFAIWHHGAGAFRRAWLHIAAIAFTSLIAGLATAPFQLYHFDRFITYGLLGNILAVPVTAFWIMPWAMVSFLLMPFHLERFGLIPMGAGIATVIHVARWVAGLKGDVVLVPQMPMAGLLSVVAGVLWLCVWRRRWRLFGLVAIGIGLASIPLASRPDLLIDARGRIVALREPDGALTISPGRADRMAAETWLQRDGAAAASPWPRKAAGAESALRCDSLGCLYHHHGTTIALVWREAALPADCRVAQVVVSPLVLAAGRCRSARLVIDGRDLAQNGAYALYLGSGGQVRAVSVAHYRGLRPWSGLAASKGPAR